MVLGADIVMIGDPFETLETFYDGIDKEKAFIGKKGAENIGRLALRYVQYAEGDLAASIGWNDTSVWAGGPKLVAARKRDYAWFVEYGTSKTPAQPFMRPAMAQGAAQTAVEAANRIKVHWKGNSRIVPLSRAYAGIRIASLFK